jgi:hypothetical protein
MIGLVGGHVSVRKNLVADRPWDVARPREIVS